MNKPAITISLMLFILDVSGQRIEDYIPKKGDNDKIIKINFNIFQDSSGEGNFKNVLQDSLRLATMFNWLNGIYANNPPPSDPVDGVTELPKTFIQFERAGTYYYRNNSLTNSINSYELLQEIKKTDPGRMNQLNICFTNGEMGTAKGFADRPSANLEEDMFVVMLKCFNNGSNNGDYPATVTLAHEMGHNLGLLHTYNGGGASAHCGTSADDPEYLCDIYGPWPGNCPHFYPDAEYPWDYDTKAINGDGRTNNIMGGFRSSSYFSPMQIGIMHRALSAETPKRYVKQE